MNGDGTAYLAQLPPHKGYHFLLAQHTQSEIRLYGLGEFSVVLKDGAIYLKEIEGSPMLKSLIDMKMPVVLVNKGAFQPFLAGADQPGQEKPREDSIDDSGPKAYYSIQDSHIQPETLSSSNFLPIECQSRVSLLTREWRYAKAGTRIKRAIDFMLRHFQEPISLDDVAREACLSPCYFCRLFKKQVGTTYTKYLSSVRIEEAATLLLYSDLAVTEICYNVGFNDLTHFERVFKSFLRATPTDFRRHRSDGQNIGTSQ